MTDVSFSLFFLAKIWDLLKNDAAKAKVMYEEMAGSKGSDSYIQTLMGDLSKHFEPSDACGKILIILAKDMVKNHRSLSSVATSSFFLELAVTLYTICHRKSKAPSQDPNVGESKKSGSLLFNYAFDSKLL